MAADPTDAQKVIAEVLGKHESWQRAVKDDHDWRCACGKVFGLKVNLDYHVAAAVEEALGGLRREWCVGIEYPPRPEDGYPGAVVVLDSYKLREAAVIVKRSKYPEDDYSVFSCWRGAWTPEETP